MRKILFLSVVLIFIVFMVGCTTQTQNELPKEPPAIGEAVATNNIAAGQAFKTPADWRNAPEDIRSAFAPPFNVFNNNQVFLTAIPEEAAVSSFDSNVEITIRDRYLYYPGLQDVLVYRYFYVLDRLGVWQQHEFQGNLVEGTNFIKGSARKLGLPIPMSSLMIDTESGNLTSNYVIAYSCIRNNSRWYCSCNTTTDCNKYWSIQEFKVRMKKPNLRVLSVQFTPQRPAINEPVEVNVTLLNDGEGDAGPFDVDIIATSTSSTRAAESIPVDRINAYSTKTISTQLTFSEIGTYQFLVDVDPSRLVLEVNEDDNQFIITNLYVGRMMYNTHPGDMGWYKFSANRAGQLRAIDLRGLYHGGSDCYYQLYLYNASAAAGDSANLLLSRGTFHIRLNESLPQNSEVLVYMDYEYNQTTDTWDHRPDMDYEYNETTYTWDHRPDYGDKLINLVKNQNYWLRVTVPTAFNCSDAPALQMRLFDDGNPATNVSRVGDGPYDIDMDLIWHEGRPDIKVNYIEVIPDPISAGEPFQVKYHFRNAGDALFNTTLSNQHLSMKVISTDPDVYSLDMQAPHEAQGTVYYPQRRGENTVVTPILIFTTPGNKFLNASLWAASGGEYARNHWDNYVYKTVQVVETEADLSVRFEYSGWPRQGVRNVFTPYVRNIGTGQVTIPANFEWIVEYKGSTGDFAVACERNLSEERVLLRNSETALPGCGIALSDPYNTVRVRIDTTGVLNESDLTNNKYSENIDYSPRPPTPPGS